MDGWELAVDIGTSRTATAMFADGVAELLEVEDGRYLPSTVCVGDDGTLLVGRAAVAHAAIFPERAERVPKRALAAGDHVRLAGATYPTVYLIGAILAKVAGEASHRYGAPPSGLLLTHPARWGEREVGLLAHAARAVSLPLPRFMPEPVAAARHYLTAHQIAVGQCVAVYDLGGGTLDTAVLRRTADGFVLAGPPGGNERFGGEDLDTALRRVIAVHAREVDAEAWDRIWTAEGRAAARTRQRWRDAITAKKEELSSATVVTVYEEGFEHGMRITRAEYEAEIAPTVRASVNELRASIERARLTAGELAAIHLTGGASRTPLVSDLIHEATGLLPTTTGDPKSAVVMGAIAPLPPTAPPTAAPATATLATDAASLSAPGLPVFDIVSAGRPSPGGPSAVEPSFATTSPDTASGHGATGRARRRTPRRRRLPVLVALVAVPLLAVGSVVALQLGGGSTPSAAPPATGGTSTAGAGVPVGGQGLPSMRPSATLSLNPPGPGLIVPTGDFLPYRTPAAFPSFDASDIFYRNVSVNGNSFTAKAVDNSNNCSILINNPEVASRFQRDGCTAWVGAEYQTQDKQIDTSLAYFMVASSADAQSLAEETATAQGVYGPLVVHGTPHPTDAVLNVTTQDRFVVVTLAWYADGSPVGTGRQELSDAAATIASGTLDGVPSPS